MNEVTLHRGRHSHLAVVDVFVDDEFLTESVVSRHAIRLLVFALTHRLVLQSDGLILATPTGSTAYSLSSGGPILHPSLSSTILLTPISPRSLSFRPVLLPSSSVITLRVNARSRAPIELTMDGREVGLLRSGEGLRVGKSREGVPCVRRDGEGGDEWVRDIKCVVLQTINQPVELIQLHGEAALSSNLTARSGPRWMGRDLSDRP